MLARFKALNIGIIMASGLAFSQLTFAQALGEITLDSGLYQPLDASIELLDVAGLDENQLSISMGTEEDFARANIELSPLVAQVQFEVVLNGDTGKIHLTTSSPVEELFLYFIINATLPNGKLLREYTVLLDLPDAASEAVNVPADSSNQYTVNSGDNLFQIAMTTRPTTEVGIEQMMLAIVRTNEDAFVNNNINRILTGRVLRIPTLQEISLVDQATAVTEVNQQNQQLNLEPLAGVADNTSATRTPQLQDKLSVLTDDQDANAGNGDLSATIAALENELMLSEENLDRARLENLELNSQLASLEQELDILQNIIALEDERIAKLQADLAAAAQRALTTAQGTSATQEKFDADAASQNGIMGSIATMLESTAVLMSTLVVLIISVSGFLFIKRRRAEVAELDFETESAYNTSVYSGSGLVNKLVALLALFSRKHSAEADRRIDVSLGLDDFPKEDLPVTRQLNTTLSQPQKVDDNEAYSPAIEETEFDLDTLNFDENTLDNTEEEISFEASAMDECDTKLDLAVAYEAMGDIVGALEILEEVKADGNSDQVAAARRLQQQWQNS